MTFDPYANQGGAAAWDPDAAAASNEAADELFAAETSDVSDADVTDAEYLDADLDDGTATQPYYLTEPDTERDDSSE